MESGVLLGLDIGSVRIGVASVRLDVRIPQPLMTIAYRPEVFAEIGDLVQQQAATALVVGWPRGLEGQTTNQTTFVDDFVTELRPHVSVPIYMQDEALTSQKAEAELQSRQKPYQKEAVDALAATYILEDYLITLEEQAHV